MPVTTRTALLSPTGGRSRNELHQLIATARRRDLTREPGPMWPVYAINGNQRPEVRPMVVLAIKDGLLVDETPDASHSTIVPTDAGLHKIGASR